MTNKIQDAILNAMSPFVPELVDRAEDDAYDGMPPVHDVPLGWLSFGPSKLVFVSAVHDATVPAVYVPSNGRANDSLPRKEIA